MANGPIQIVSYWPNTGRIRLKISAITPVMVKPIRTTILAFLIFLSLNTIMTWKIQIGRLSLARMFIISGIWKLLV